jgi:pilus assembly protein CpaB
MRTRIFAVLALAILAGGGLAYGTYNFMQNAPAKTVATPTQPVVVAAANLQLGSELKKEDLKVANFPSGQAPEGTFAKPGDLIGRGLIVPVVANEPILAAKLASKEAGAGLPPVIPEGMRAVSVRVNEVIGVAGYVLPGTRVDVLATATPTTSRADTTTKLILSNVQVLTAGTRVEDQEKGKPMQVTVVTLLVTPEQAEHLALAATEGKIQLALRNPLDQTSPETRGVRTAGLLTGQSTVRTAPRIVETGSSASPRRAVRPVVESAVPAPAALPTVEVIRGDKRATEVIR